MLTIFYKQLLIYKTETGLEPFCEWLTSFGKDPTVKARIMARLDRLERGHYGMYKKLGTGLLELKLNFGPGYRIYFTKRKNRIILICGGNKSTQIKDIAIAKKYWQEIKGEIYD